MFANKLRAYFFTICVCVEHLLELYDNPVCVIIVGEIFWLCALRYFKYNNSADVLPRLCTRLVWAPPMLASDLLWLHCVLRKIIL